MSAPARWPTDQTLHAAAVESIEKGVATALPLIREALKAEAEAATVPPLRRAALLDMAAHLRARAVTEMQIRTQDVADEAGAAA